MPRKLRVHNLESVGYSPKAQAIIESFAEYETVVNAKFPPPDVYITRLQPLFNGWHTDIDIKAVVTATTGLDHINQTYCRDQLIDILSLQGETEFLQDVHATAEHTFALMLALLRKIPQAVEHTKEGGWDRYRFIGNELHGKTLGILGYGRVGKQVAQIAQAFGMSVWGYDKYDDYRKPSLKLFLEGSDALTIHVPLNDETRGMIGRDEIYSMPKGAYLINTSRGEVVDEVAVVDALEKGHLSGAALDVLRKEGSATTNMWASAVQETENLIITPHIGGATHESMEKTEIFMAEKLKRWAQEKGYA